MVQHDDEALHRLQRSDPATGSHPDLGRLRSLIAHRAPASQRGDSTAQVDDLLRDPVIRAPWVAAACIAALAIGAGGYVLGAQRSTDTLLVADQGGLLAPAGGGVEAGVSAEMGASASVESSGSESAPEPYDPGPVRLVPGPDLSDERSTGQVRVLRSDEDPAAFVEAWAGALDLQGVPIPNDVEFLPEGEGIADAETGRFIIATNEGGGLQLTYSDFFSSSECGDTLTMIEADEEFFTEFWQETFGADTPLPSAADCTELTGPRPTQEEARTAAVDFLTRAGLSLEGYTFRVDEMDPSSTEVYVEGAPPGGAYGPLHLFVRVGPSGVVLDANAGIGEMVSIGDYPVISPVEAVQRYQDDVFSMHYGVQLPEDLEEDTSGSGVRFIEPDLPPTPEIEDGMRLPLLLKDKEVTGAKLVQASIYTEAGSMEVPTWRLTTADGMSYPVMAVADEAIDWISWE
ncbi:hypothetical protein [Serinicoccus kebangsaanensis]|uniref:hypothetical protein n=1 Tax=Serinicoccus kebangsaanensis TaxID=2602069 RepID=UPI00124EBECA|nr:hypothetical protein [Serinicoccus kebangsaanensis]